MADSKLAHKDPTEGASPAPRTKSNDDVPRSRSERKDRSKGSGSTDPAPAGNPRKLDFGNGEGEKYSPRTIDPEIPYPPKQVARLVATYEGMQGVETDGEATQRHNKEADEQKTATEDAAKQALHKEAAADGFAAVEQADAAVYTAALELAKADEPEPIQVTKTNPFATPAAAQQEATPAVAAEQPTPNPEQIPVTTPTPTKRKKNTGGDEKDDDDEMEEDEGDPTTLAPEVQLRKIHQTLRMFSDRMANNEESIEGQGRMIDEVAARHRQEEQERISKAYEILGIPEKANAT